MLQPFAIADATREWYRGYVRAGFPLRDPALDAEREELIDRGLLWTDTFVSLGRPGRTGPPLASADGLDERTLALPWGFDDLYDHQHRAIERLRATRDGGPANTLVLSGTGSGKTESFLIPIVDACLRNPGPGVKAIILYPMNALANDQFKRLSRLLADTPEVTYGRYTGDAPESDAGDSRRAARPSGLPDNVRWSRQAMRDEPPDILLTNYSMLEYLLLRRKDQELFAHQSLRYVVVDEIHLFTGVLGSEVASLLRRFRQHLDRGPEELTYVGTSATAGSEDERARLLGFASKFFGAPFGDDAAIEETPAPLRESGHEVPPTTDVTPAQLDAASDTAGLSALAQAALGLDLPDNDETAFRLALGAEVDRFRTVGVIERALARPAPITTAAEALGELAERRGATTDALYREASALILLGAAAHQKPVGEEDPEPRFRPRVHQIIRSLSGLWRCLDTACGHLARPTDGRCPVCEKALTLPLASCRTCGEAYWSAPAATTHVDERGLLPPRDFWRGEDAFYLADPERLSQLIDQDEDGDRVDWLDLALCPSCGGKGPIGDVLHDRACSSPLELRFHGSGDPVHCPSCGDKGAGGRPILLPLRGSAAASVAVMTQSLSDELRAREGASGGRLLVFADSRQDAAQQAGYADDQGARIAVRQLLVAALEDAPRALNDAVNAVKQSVTEDQAALRRWLIGESDRDFAELADPEYVPSEEDEKGIARQLTWEVVLDVTERARRRFSLEREGLVVVSIDRLEEIVDGMLAKWPGHPFASGEQARQVTQAVVDIMRYRRAVDHWMLKRAPRTLQRNHDLRIGDRAVLQTRGWAERKYNNRAKQVDIRSWTSPPHVTTFTELFQRVLEREHADIIELVDAFATRLMRSGLLASSVTEGKKRYMLDHQRLILAARVDESLWRCDHCGAIRASTLTATSGRTVCANWRCPGQPEPWEPDPTRDFYRRQYLSEPRRLLVREHSGQVAGEERIAIEERFNDAVNPTIDVLACTPTLEVGVSLDDLHAVILRNLPPTPANYAQRIGRAGRRSKVALALTHAGAGPHDTYYFEGPERMIAGEVRAPAISLDNEPLLRRHVNSLIFEVLGLDLPRLWVPKPDPDGELGEQETIAGVDGILRESALAPFREALEDEAKRGQVLDAIRGAFASPEDPAPPANAEAVCQDQLDRFLPDLRVALMRWCERFRRLLEEHSRMGVTLFARLTEEEIRYRDRLERELRRLMEPGSPDQHPLGFLGLVGFLPRYGFTGTTVLLHPPGGEEPIGQGSTVAVTEYAPGNIVYARGKRLKVTRLDPAPVIEGAAGAEHRDNVIREARRCDRCDYLTFEPIVKQCPTCGSDLRGQPVVTFTGVRASGGAISADDEYRSREDYDVGYLLGGDDPAVEVVNLAGFDMSRFERREIVVANRGPRLDDGDRPDGFRICSACGFAQGPSSDDDDGDEEAVGAHTPRCAGKRDSELIRERLWLTADIQGDVIEVELPPAARDDSFAAWRATLSEALLFGMRENLDADRRDLNSFERRQDEVPYSIVIYDTMPGGTGYLPKLFAEGAEGLKAAAATALERLESCECERSCHRCLQDFWNQRVHAQLDRHEVLSVLRRMADAEAREELEAENDQLESFLEREFFQRLEAAGLPRPSLQVTREFRGTGKARIVTRVDAAYSNPNISIFLDGKVHIASVDKILSDWDKRNALEAKGHLVLEFTFADVMYDFERVLAALTRALHGEVEDPDLDPESVPGVDLDEPTRRVGSTARIDPEAWVRSASVWRSSLRSANRLRLAGWRLRRVRGGPPGSAPAARSDEEYWGPAPSDEELAAAQRRASERLSEMTERIAGESLTLADVADRMSASVQEVQAMGDRGELVLVGAPPDVRVPSWQFHDGGADTVEGLGRLISAFPGGPVWLSAWMTTAMPELEGRTPLDVLTDGDVERVVALAESRGS